jgi:hypothetical protein
MELLTGDDIPLKGAQNVTHNEYEYGQLELNTDFIFNRYLIQAST